MVTPGRTRLRALALPLASPESQVVPRFGVTSAQGGLVEEILPGTPANQVLGFSDVIGEVFLADGRHLLQLTNFGRVDTVREFLSTDGSHAFFRASADPFGTNPTENCQLFSIDTTGAHLRQVTRFEEGAHSINGCQDGPPPGCGVVDASQDPVTGTVVFFSGCDPSGTTHIGGQIYAMRPDGSRLRPLTDTRGLTVDADGVTVELPGPFAYSAVVR